MKIKSRFTDKVIFEKDVESMRQLVEAAVAAGVSLLYANLSYADLRGANLRGANLSDSPKIENIHQTVFDAASQPGALDMSDWHTCDTTHCRAGWVTHLAGKAGAALEKRMGPSAAATLIYMSSDPKLEKIPDFQSDNETAMEDMKRLAELEAVAGRVA